MDKGSVERLRFDRRLQNRPDWIEKADQDTYLDALPDVSQKMTTCAEEEEASEVEATEAESAPVAPPAAPAPPAAAPVAGDFSASRPFGDVGGDSSGN